MYVIQSHPKHPILLNFTRVEKLGEKMAPHHHRSQAYKKNQDGNLKAWKCLKKRAKHLQTTPRKIDMEPENTGPPGKGKSSSNSTIFRGWKNVHLRGCIIFVAFLSHSFLQGPPAWTSYQLSKKPPKNEKTARSHHPQMPCWNEKKCWEFCLSIFDILSLKRTATSPLKNGRTKAPKRFYYINLPTINLQRRFLGFKEGIFLAPSKGSLLFK